MIISREAVEKIIDKIDSDLFNLPIHKLIINTIKKLYQNGIPIDLVILNKELFDDNEYQAVGGSTYLNELTEDLPTPANVEYYISILQERFTRNNISIFVKETERLLNEKTTLTDISTYMKDQVDLIQSNDIKVGLEQKYQQFFDLTSLEVQKLFHEQLSKSQIKTGFQLIDNDFSLSPTDFNIIQSMSNHGKTSFMIQLLTNFLENEPNTTCHFITYETTQLRLISKILNNIAQKHHQKLFYQKVTGEDTFSGETTATAIFDQWIKDKRLSVMQNITYENLKAFVKLIKKHNNNKTIVLFLDYIQIIPNSFKSEGWQKIKDLSYGLERLAVDENIIIFTGSQVNDKGETREGKDIYNSATNVINIFNHSHDKLINSEKAKMYRAKEDNNSIISITIDKAKYFKTNHFSEAFYFNGHSFEEKWNYDENHHESDTSHNQKAIDLDFDVWG